MKTNKERLLRLVTDAGLFCLVVVIGITKAALQYHYAEYSHFSLSGPFLHSFLENPGGLLDYAGAFLTQFCRFPTLGALILGILAVLLRRLVEMGFGQGKHNLPLSLIPPLCAVLFVSGARYGVYTPGSYGIAFSQTIGLCSALGLYLLGRHLSWKRWGGIAMAGLIALTYSVLGFFALLAGMMIVLLSLRERTAGAVALPVSLIILILPLAVANLGFLYPRINIRYAFLGGIPYQNFLFCPTSTVPLVVAVLGTLLVPVLSPRKIPVSVGAVAALAASFALVFFSSRDSNFDAQLRMERAMDASDWDQVLRIAHGTKNPNRILVLYRDIALYQQGELCNRMFEYPDGSAPLLGSGGLPMSLTYGPELYLRTGLVNNAERWATELSVSYIKCTHYLKVLTLAALLREDFPLSEKYLSVLSENPFLRPWVRKYSVLARNPESLARDPEIARILPLVKAGGPALIAGDVAESVVWHHFSSVPAANPDLYQWKMAALMTQKREAAFMDEFLLHARSCPDESVPLGIAQAAVLFGGTSGDRDLYLQVFNLFKDDTALMREFSAFGKSYNAASDVSSEYARKRYREKYGKTYWFYYYFINDIQSN
ncbi:MAG: DUF6057 family protein [Bacteroidales bacterium]|nr:DUF6057 family protein [Bacteroidales bacterium]